MAHGAAALLGAAAAGAAAEAVIDGELFAGFDSPETVQEDLAAEAAHCQIRVATVVDELGAASSYRSIERRTPIHVNQVNPPSFPREGYASGTTPGFPLADSFTRVLDDPLAARDRFLREHSVSLDARTANAEPEAGELRIDARNVALRGHIKPRRAGERVARRQSATPIAGHSQTDHSKIKRAMLDDQWLGVRQGLGLLELLGAFFLRCHGFSPF